MRENILRKLKSKDFTYLVQNEMNFILNDIELQIEIMEKFSDIKEYWDRPDFLLDSILQSLFEGNLKDKKNLVEKYIYRGLIYSNEIYFDDELLTRINGYFDENSPYKRKILDFFYSQLETDDNLEYADFGDKTLKYLILNKKFDSISKITDVVSFTIETATLFLKSYPLTTYGMPKFFDKLIKRYYHENEKENELGLIKIINEIELKYFSNDFLLDIFLKLYSHIDAGRMREIVNEIFDRMIKFPREFNEIFKINISGYKKIASYLLKNTQEYKDILIELFENNIYYFSHLMITEYSENDLLKKVCDNIENDDLLLTFLITVDSNNYKNLDMLINTLIENGKINYILDYLETNINEEIIAVIIHEIESGNSNYNRDINDLSLKIFKYPNILKAILSSNKIYNFSFLEFYIPGKLPESILEDCKNYMINSSLSIIYPKVSSLPFLLEVYIAKEKNEEIIDWFANTSEFYTTPTIIKKLEDILKENPKYLERIFNSDNAIKFAFLSNEIIISCLNFEGYSKKIIEYMANCDDFNIFNYSITVRLVTGDILSKNPEYIDIISSGKNAVVFAFLSSKILNICLESGKFDQEMILHYGIHHDECKFFFTQNICELLKDFIIKKYNVSGKNFTYIVENIGPQILKYIENENIINFLRLDFQVFQKICDLFAEKEYSISDLHAAYDSLSQYQFTQKNGGVINIFSNIIHYLENCLGNGYVASNITFYVNDISKYLDDKFFSAFFKKYELPSDVDTKEKMLRFILEKIMFSSNSTKYKNILHEITDYYIMKKREEYRQNCNMYEDMGLPFEFNKKSAINLTAKFFLTNPNNLTFYYLDGETFYDRYVSYFKACGYSSSQFESFLSVAVNPNSKNQSLDKKTVNNMRRLFKQFLEINYKKLYIINIVNSVYDIKTDYIFNPKFNEEDIYIILNGLALNSFIEGVINNDDVYESLLTIMRKRKIHILPEVIGTYINKYRLKLDYTIDDITAFISNYYKIFQREKSTLSTLLNGETIPTLPLVKIIKLAITYSQNLEYYNIILNPEDADFIKNNPIPNSATRKTKNNIRLKDAVSFTKSNFLRNKVTIPTFNEVLSIKNKSMRIIAGNFTHPSNLTHGERTGACMRIGGVGESLFNFVLTNKNGFHIRFEDENGEYISRVSGFRNGNTVFLNELRYSLNPKKYSNKDVVAFCKLAANKIIELSMNSDFPIENVVICNAYATVDSNLPSKNLRVSNIKSGLPEFYSDVSNRAIVLATTSQNDFAPIKLEAEVLPEYLPAREITIYSDDLIKVEDTINRIHAIDILLKSNMPEYEIQRLSFGTGFICGYVNMDWYAYLDSNGNVHSEIIKNDSRAEIELNEAIEVLSNKKLNNI